MNTLNAPNKEIICRDPKGKGFELHKWICQFPQMRFCSNCGTHHPNCSCKICEGKTQ